MKDSHINFQKNPDAWQTKAQTAVRLPFPIAWLVVGAIVFGCGLLIRWVCGESSSPLRSMAIDATLIAAIANAVVYFEKLMDEAADSFFDLLDEEDHMIEKWLRDWYHDMFWSRRNLLSGCVLAVILVLGNYWKPFCPFVSKAGIIYSYVIAFMIGFFGGSMFWTMLGIARLTKSLGEEVKLTASIFDSETSALRCASSVLWKVSIVSGLVYLLGCLAISLSLRSAWVTRMGIDCCLCSLSARILHRSAVEHSQNAYSSKTSPIEAPCYPD